MAEEIIGLNIQTNLGGLRSQLKEATAEVQRLSDKFGESSREANEAAMKAAKIKDAIGDANTKIAAFNPDRKFAAFSQSIQGVAGAFAGMQGAMGLMGIESQNVQKQLLKVQSALAFSEGLNTFLDTGIQGFKNLFTTITSSSIALKVYNTATVVTTAVMRALGISVNVTSVSFKVLRGVLISTGIGALIVGVGLLVNALMNMSNATEKAANKQKELNEKIKEGADATLNAEIKLLKSTQKLLEAEAEARGDSAKKILELQNSGRRLEIAAHQRNYDEKKGIDKVEDKKTLDTIKDLQNEIKIADLKLKKELREQGEKDKEEDAADTKKKKEEDAAIDKKKKEDRVVAINSAEKELENIKNDNHLKSIKNEEEREIEKIRIEFEKRLTEINDLNINENLKTSLIIAETEKRQLLLDGIDNTKKDRLQKQKEEAIENDAKLKEKQLQDTIAFNDKIFAADKDLADKKTALVFAGLDLLSSVAGKNEGIANAIFAIQKAIEIGRIITSTIAAIQAVKTSVAMIPKILPPAFPNPAFLVAAAGGLKSIASLKLGAAASITGILATSIGKLKGGGGGSGMGGGGGIDTSAPLAPTAQATGTTNISQSSINQLGSGAMRAYVVETDIRTGQERQRRIDRAARII